MDASALAGNLLPLYNYVVVVEWVIIERAVILNMIYNTIYRRKVLKGKLGERLKVIMLQVCQQNKIIILKGKIMEDYVHLMISWSSSVAPSKIVQLIKGRSSKMIQEEFQEIKKKYWGTTYLGNGIFYKNGRSSNRSNDTRICWITKWWGAWDIWLGNSGL